jgi:hypothetical protein
MKLLQEAGFDGMWHYESCYYFNDFTCAGFVYCDGHSRTTADMLQLSRLTLQLS